MEEVGLSTTPGDSNETVLLEMSQAFIQQLHESKDREIKLQEKIRILEKEREIQNGAAVPNQQQHHGVQELHQQITELTQQFRQLKSNSDEKVQRLSNEVARLETEAKDKDAKIKDMTVLENAHQSAIDSTRTTTPMDELRDSFADEDQANERGPSERRLPRGSNGRNTSKGTVYDDEEQSTPMGELRDSFVANAQDLLSRMDQVVQSIRGDEGLGERPCLQPPGARARRALAVDVRADAVSRHEKPVEDLQKRFDKLVNVSEKRLKHIRLLEHENGKICQRLDEANAQLERMRVASETRDQQLANRDNQERGPPNAATLELKAQLKEANEEIERLAKQLDVNEHRLADTQKFRSEAEERVKQANAPDVERKLREYEENRVELRRFQREIERLTVQREEAWRQVDDLRKMNEDMNASAAQTINEKESALERIVVELQMARSEKDDLQTRIHSLEDENQRLKEANELFEDDREIAASHFQREQSTYEARIAKLQRTVSRATEDARREQRKLQDEIVKLKEHRKQVEGCAKVDATELESARKKAEDLEAGQLAMATLLSGKYLEIDRLKEDLCQANLTNRMNQDFPYGFGHKSGGSSQYAGIHGAQGKRARSRYASDAQRGNADRICTICNLFPLNAKILPCEHAVGCDKCLNEAVEQTKECPQCHMKVKAWAYIPLQ